MRRKHVVLVQNFLKTTGSLGQAKYDEPDGEPIRVLCNAHPLDAELIKTNGLQEHDTRHLYADFWPGNAHSRVTYNGATWEPHGLPQVYDISAAANSVQIIIKKRG